MSNQETPFLFNARASFQDRLTLFLDISGKDDIIKSFFYEGPAAATFAGELEEIKSLALGKTISEAKFLSRHMLKLEHLNANFRLSVSSLGLTLLKEAILDYLGENRTYQEERDYLCLCFGVTRKEIIRDVLADENFNIATLVEKTKATSACGSCLPAIEELISQTRYEHGKLYGVKDSRARVDKNGNWIKVQGLWPAELLVKLDDLKKEWMKREGISELYHMEIVAISGLHLDFKITDPDGALTEDRKQTALISALSEFYQSQTGILFFLHAL